MHTETACYDRQYKEGGWSPQVSDGGAERGGGGGERVECYKVIIMNFLSSSCIVYIFKTDRETDR